MVTEPLDSGPVGPSDTTADLAAVTNDETEDESHEPCYLFSREGKHLLHTNIKRLRLGVTAACQGCSIVLDAVTTYSSGRLCMDSIRDICVILDSWRIEIYTGERKRIRLELFRLEGKLYTCRFVCFR
jgi:hypothetical protein